MTIKHGRYIAKKLKKTKVTERSKNKLTTENSDTFIQWQNGTNSTNRRD